jgi:hypothetical protein
MYPTSDMGNPIWTTKGLSRDIIIPPNWYKFKDDKLPINNDYYGDGKIFFRDGNLAVCFEMITENNFKIRQYTDKSGQCQGGRIDCSFDKETKIKLLIESCNITLRIQGYRVPNFDSINKTIVVSREEEMPVNHSMIQWFESHPPKYTFLADEIIEDYRKN